MKVLVVTGGDSELKMGTRILIEHNLAHDRKPIFIYPIDKKGNSMLMELVSVYDPTILFTSPGRFMIIITGKVDEKSTKIQLEIEQ